MSAQSQSVLMIKDLKKTFGTKAVHRGIDIELFENEVLALFGGSGAGKSLILRSIIGLESPDSGAISWRNRNLSGLSENQWIDIRKRIAYVFQNGALFDSLTVFENLAYPLREHTQMNEEQIRAKVAETLAMVDMPGSEALLPSELSGGMQKRVGLARAMILEPEIILFDEPTAGLDPSNTARFVQNILKLKARGLTGIFVTHDLASAFAVADRIAILHEGKIYCAESPEKIRQSNDPIIRNFLFPEEKT
ncbi:MAG: ATP-binding cassette domain-containing protein [Bdellovibrionales bacterium]|nr:ATP-binding cassette domain-containing protein [Bdellovibrionales bacterium]